MSFDFDFCKSPRGRFAALSTPAIQPPIWLIDDLALAERLIPCGHGFVFFSDQLTRAITAETLRLREQEYRTILKQLYPNQVQGRQLDLPTTYDFASIVEDRAAPKHDFFRDRNLYPIPRYDLSMPSRFFAVNLHPLTTSHEDYLRQTWNIGGKMELSGIFNTHRSTLWHEFGHMLLRVTAQLPLAADDDEDHADRYSQQHDPELNSIQQWRVVTNFIQMISKGSVIYLNHLRQTPEASAHRLRHEISAMGELQLAGRDFSSQLPRSEREFAQAICAGKILPLIMPPKDNVDCLKNVFRRIQDGKSFKYPHTAVVAQQLLRAGHTFMPQLLRA